MDSRRGALVVSLVLVVGLLAACAADEPSPEGVEPRDWLGAADPGPGATGARAPGQQAQPFAPVRPEVLATDLTAPQGLAVDGMRVYWTDVDGPAAAAGSVLVLAKSGGNPAPLVSWHGDAGRVAVDDLAVYWTDVDSGAVVRADKLGGPARVVVDRLAGPAFVALGERALYVSDFYGGVILQAAKDGSASSLVAEVAHPGPLAVRGERVYFADRSEGLIAAAVAGEVMKLAAGQQVAGNLVADDHHVYWSDDVQRMILRVSVGGGPVETVAKHQFRPRGLALRGGHLYWVTQGDGSVHRIELNGGEPETLATGQLAPTEIAVDSSGIYWLDPAAGRLMRRAH